MEHSGAAMDSVSYFLVVVMQLKNVLMEAMRLTVVSYNIYVSSTHVGWFAQWKITIMSTYHEYIKI